MVDFVSDQVRSNPCINTLSMYNYRIYFRHLIKLLILFFLVYVIYEIYQISILKNTVEVKANLGHSAFVRDAPGSMEPPYPGIHTMWPPGCVNAFRHFRDKLTRFNSPKSTIPVVNWRPHTSIRFS